MRNSEPDQSLPASEWPVTRALLIIVRLIWSLQRTVERPKACYDAKFDEKGLEQHLSGLNAGSFGLGAIAVHSCPQAPDHHS